MECLAYYSQEEPVLNINYIDDGIPNLIENNEVKDLELTILEINEKYEITKRWRAEESEEYFYIGSSGIVWSVGDEFYDEDNDNYNL